MRETEGEKRSFGGEGVGHKSENTNILIWRSTVHSRAEVWIPHSEAHRGGHSFPSQAWRQGSRVCCFRQPLCSNWVGSWIGMESDVRPLEVLIDKSRQDNQVFFPICEH